MANKKLIKEIQKSMITRRYDGVQSMEILPLNPNFERMFYLMDNSQAIDILYLLERYKSLQSILERLESDIVTLYQKHIVELPIRKQLIERVESNPTGEITVYTKPLLLKFVDETTGAAYVIPVGAPIIVGHGGGIYMCSYSSNSATLKPRRFLHPHTYSDGRVCFYSEKSSTPQLIAEFLSNCECINQASVVTNPLELLSWSGIRMPTQYNQRFFGLSPSKFTEEEIEKLYDIGSADSYSASVTIGYYADEMLPIVKITYAPSWNSVTIQNGFALHMPPWPIDKVRVSNTSYYLIGANVSVDRIANKCEITFQ